MIFPTRERIIDLNRRLIRDTGGFYGGTDNLKNADSLEWVLEAIRYPLFGIDLYPTLVEKAAALAWKIISDHVFHEGNKRTGIAALKIFIEVNGYDLNANEDEYFEIALNIANGSLSSYHFDDFVLWIRKRIFAKTA